MKRDSIRWRLPLSYAAIALLAVLALGCVLLLTLRGYYLRVERDYLRGNARAIGFSLAQLLEGDPPPEVLQSQLDSLAFLSRTRVRVLDTSEQLVASSDPRRPVALTLAAARAIEADPLDARTRVLIRPGALPTATLPISEGAVVWVPFDPGGRVALPVGELPRLLPLLGERLRREVVRTVSQPLSGQVVQVPVRGSEDQLLGYIEASQGPAYAREIVTNVAWGLGIAGALAVALAAGVGWVISRRISSPLVALTEVTASMAGGDLAARADLARQDELGTLAQSFNRMADQVEETITTLRRFVSDAAHEIHTPLTALHTNLELARQDAPAGTEHHVVQAQAQVERLEALTGGLLDLSRLESGAQAPHLVPLPLLPLIQEMGERYASRAEQAGLAFELSLPESPLSVLGEGAQLRSALTNLLDNAFKFTPESGHVCLGLRREGKMAVLWVEDSGIGIPEADMPHLFQRFRRGSNAAAYPGSGLGLAIVKAVAIRHGGQVHAERTRQGSRFTLEIPVA